MPGGVDVPPATEGVFHLFVVGGTLVSPACFRSFRAGKSLRIPGKVSLYPPEVETLRAL